MTAAEEYEQLAATIGTLRLPRAYCPLDPTPKQDWFLRSDSLEAFFGGAAGPGKALALDTPLATPYGWATIGEVEPGDVVLDKAGDPTLVLAASEVTVGRPVYRVEFSDGAAIVADGDHLWETLTLSERAARAKRQPEYRARRRSSRPSQGTGARPHVAVLNRERDHVLLEPPEPTTRSTAEIAASLIHSGRRNHSVVRQPGLNLPDRYLPLDPYVLGVWLGDGTTSTGSFTCHHDDQEIVDEVEAAGYECRGQPSNPLGVRVVGLTSRLRELGLLGTKIVPLNYLRASAAQRLALLQGLMDTDGHCARDGRCEFTSMRPQLAYAVCELVRTLGASANVLEGRATLDGRDVGPKYRVGFQLDMPAFRLTRKAERQRLERRSDHRMIVDAKPVESVPVRCIRTSAGTYLAGREMVPTHNSYGLLMAAMQYVDVPGYHGLLLRPTLAEFEQPGNLIEVSHDWLNDSPAWWNGNKRSWTFPGGASIRFGYLATRTDLAQYKGPSYSFCGFDELTSFPEQLYRGMFRVLRQRVGTLLDDIPLRMRAASNPGDIGHTWVKARFIEPATRDPAATFVRATIHDNPHLDYQAYLESLAHLSPVDRQRLIEGDWDVLEEGGKFRRESFHIVDPSEVKPAVKSVRYWDLAGSEPSPAYPDPDWTVGLLLEVDAAGTFTIRHIVRGRWNDDKVEANVRMTAEADGTAVPVYIEQDPGQAGKAQLANYKRRVLQGFAVHAGLTRIGGKNAAKEVRARPVAAAVGNDLVQIASDCPHLREFIDEAAMFPNGHKDDCVDALSGGHNALTKRSTGGSSTSVPRGRIPRVAERLDTSLGGRR